MAKTSVYAPWLPSIFGSCDSRLLSMDAVEVTSDRSSLMIDKGVYPVQLCIYIYIYTNKYTKTSGNPERVSSRHHILLTWGCIIHVYIYNNICI